jgi:hypothetical protein
LQKATKKGKTEDPGSLDETHEMGESIRFPCEKSVRFDWDSLKMLETVALFEREKPATMIRRIVVEKLQVYERNPAFKRFLKELERRKENEKSRQN